jgi:polyvinyl alcohol dehydrogenase (cytochrome)
VDVGGKPTRVVGAGCKNGGFYLLRADTGELARHTPIYTGPPTHPPATHDPRVLALPSPIGGLQSGCATDGKTIFTNGIDALRLGTQASPTAAGQVPTGGRVTATSADLTAERWRHERPKAAPAGAGLRVLVREAGDPVASGVAVANGVVYFTTTLSKKLVALDAARGGVLKEIEVGPVWSGPAVSRGRVYVGTGNVLFSSPGDFSLFPHQPNGAVVSLGLAGDDEVSGLGAGSK